MVAHCNKIVILSHYATTGACEELRAWLISEKIPELIYIAFPFGHNPEYSICVERYLHGKPQPVITSWVRLKLPEPLAYAKDFVFALWYLVRYARHADLVVAGDNLLSAASVLMRRIASLGKLIYYMIDYTPVRYRNPFMNALYRMVDRFAAHRVNAVWPLTRQMIEARFKAGQMDAHRVRWYVVPYGSHPTAAAEHHREHLVYMGDLVPNKGAELLVSLALKLKERLPDFKLTVIGGGEYLPQLRQEVAQLGLERYVEICGFIREMAEVVAKLSGAGVAIAPYSPHDPNSFTFYADPGKIKVYLGCGLPVVLTDVPPIARELVEKGAGCIAAYDAQSFSDAVERLVSSANYPQHRNAATLLGAQYAWPKIFEEALGQLTPR